MIDQNELRETATSSNVFVNPLLSGVAYVPGTVITYVLRGAPGDTGDHGGAIWAQFGRRASFEAALQSWSAVANITFVEASGAYSAANTTYDWVEGFSNEAANILGSHNLPFAGTLTGEYNLASGIYSTATTGAGSMAHSTFVHEIGHGLGLLHPHNDEGDPVDDPVFPGVNDPFSTGSNNQNQGIFSVMSYNGGYVEVGLSPSDEWGWEYGPMAFDIAAIQLLYGANTATNAGATQYALPQANMAGTGWRCIWDGGGADTISAAGAAFDSIIDLREANLGVGFGAGGYVSRIAGVLGGFTIAAGAVIENAIGGSGDDRFFANAASNILDGGAGWDLVDYSGTTDSLTINLATGVVLGSGGDTLISVEAVVGGEGDDTLVARPGQLTDLARLDQLLSRDGGAFTQYGPLRIWAFTDRENAAGVPAGAGIVSATVKVVQPDITSGSRYFELIVPTAGTQVTIDIDNSFGSNISIVLRYPAGGELASNQDYGSLDPGSANILDPMLTYTSTEANERVLIEVRSPVMNSTYLGVTYDLNVSMAGTGVTQMAMLGSWLNGGSGNDTLIGGSGIDTLIGGAGNDHFDGGGNADILSGGYGADTYVVRDTSSTIVETGSSGSERDIVIAHLSYVLPKDVEVLQLVAGVEANGWGNEQDNLLYGNERSNLLSGEVGNDELFGGAGDDQLFGGEGADTLIGDDGYDQLFGGEGRDILYGSSSSSADELSGGTGDDRYVLQRPGDLVLELEGEGWDRIEAPFDMYLPDHIENLYLTGDGNFYGVGNSLDNFLGGNSGENLLIAGAGNDNVWGQDGNDALFGELGDDVIFAGYGVDYVVGGAGNDYLYGQRGADAIFGEDGDDILLADTLDRTVYVPTLTSLPNRPEFVTDILVGGDGNDTLYANSGLADYDLLDGGSGNDTYWVDTGDDLTYEAEAGGTDTVHADVLVPNAGVYLYANVENLVLEGTTSFGVGNALDNALTGSASGNWLLGGDGSDTINGKGGNDVLFGEAGSDTFVFEGTSGADVIGDFVQGQDRIRLIGSWMTFDQVSNGFHQNGSDGAIDLGNGNLIVLQGVQLSSLTASDFIFG